MLPSPAAVHAAKVIAAALAPASERHSMAVDLLPSVYLAWCKAEGVTPLEAVEVMQAVLSMFNATGYSIIMRRGEERIIGVQLLVPYRTPQRRS